jgi:hypothetical protein
MRNILVSILFLALLAPVFADPVTVTEDGVTTSIEIITQDRAQRLKALYESRYRYAYITDSLEIFARASDDDQDDDSPFQSFFIEARNVTKGEYKVGTISASDNNNVILGLMYFGSDYFFLVLFTNSYDRMFMDIEIEKRRYENIFRNSWNMLFD